jgi:hypothetical protein
LKTFICQHCGKEQPTKKNTTNKFCDNACQGAFKTGIKYRNLEAGGSESHRVVKNYLLSKFGNTCSKCKLSDWLGSPITIELEHIDGNSENNTLLNCVLLCPNCHSQTPTYKAKNIGNGRHSRRERYKNGQSF